MKVFLSYASKDQDAANTIRSVLERAGTEVVTTDDVVKLGARWSAQIGDAISSADDFVLLFSRAADESEWVQLETASAVAAESRSDIKRVIPIALERGVRLPALLAPYQYLRAWEFDSYESLGQLLDQLLTEQDTSSKEQERDSAHRELDSYRTSLAKDQESFDTTIERRSRLAARIIALALVMGVVIAFFEILSGNPSRSVLVSTVGALSTLLAAVVGFYFGSRSRER
jgi:hypothetical protein